MRYFALGWPPVTWRDYGCYLYLTADSLLRRIKILTHPTPPGLTELQYVVECKMLTLTSGVAGGKGEER